ncbi:WD40/YVTN/BNR-like repeat-containing protein [Sporolactobacillus nakayamae]|uniref:BNR/Asp-box repeat-containing protein n=1 Tax=Sporolactobacillus nakayamae TaxID=269670 RepID=A0A1I2VT82_9BACL|nr:sialidase family protein [Sporolactobacillus nakayamae]SFG92360.1 BNR/Asp-box repeat-containing protein [Sporolactobacillus nakayamae]
MKTIVLSVCGFIMIALIMTLVNYENLISFIPVRSQAFGAQDKPKQLQPVPLRPVTNAPINYTLQKSELNITYDNGKSWVKVPVDRDQLFDGEYNGNKQELIDGSYLLTKYRTAFLHSEGADPQSKSIVLTYSLDQGKTWHNSTVTTSFTALRFRKIGFISDHFGYVILSGDRTMSQESSRVFLTQDGGRGWKETASTGVTQLISDGGFVNESSGFLSYGTINPENPELYVTEDGGKSWSKAVFTMPQKYLKIFVTAEIPTREGNRLAVFVNQGPNGDYKGGKVKGKFISKDNGRTWAFSEEVQPDENQQE